MPKQSLLDPLQLKRFEREARIVARLHHTNVVSLYGAGEHNGYHFLVMELVQGQSLSRLIHILKEDPEDTTEIPETLQRYGTRYHWRELAQIGRDAALGLQHAHDRGIFHRDITPSNLLLDERGNVMLSDFGMARIVSTQGTSETQTMGGTLGYVPPEVFSGEFDERSDVFGLGSTLYELLTLKPAFDDASLAEAINRVAQRSFRPTPPRAVNQTIPKRPRNNRSEIDLRSASAAVRKREANGGRSPAILGTPGRSSRVAARHLSTRGVGADATKRSQQWRR